MRFWSSPTTTEIDRLTLAIAQGAALDAVLAALKARECERAHLQRRRLELSQAVSPVTTLDKELERLEKDVARWRELLRSHVPQARQVLKKVLKTRIVLQPEERNGVDGVAFSAEGRLRPLIDGFVPSVVTVASPAGFEPALPA